MPLSPQTTTVLQEVAGATDHALAGDVALDISLDGAAGRSTFVAGDISLAPALDGLLGRSTSLVGDIVSPRPWTG